MSQQQHKAPSCTIFLSTFWQLSSPSSGLSWKRMTCALSTLLKDNKTCGIGILSASPLLEFLFSSPAYFDGEKMYWRMANVGERWKIM